MKLFYFLYLLIYSTVLCLKQDRIIGGETARAGQFPFAAAIYKTTSNGNYFCGGTLLTTQWIITAGQCVEGAILFTIHLGTNNIKNPEPTSVKVATDEYVLHPEYNPLTLENDIGLIKLRMEVELTGYIDVIKNFPNNDLLGGAGALMAIGWGHISDESTTLEDELRWVDITTLTNDECRVVYGSQITDGMVCVVGTYNEGACIGDIGSPLVQYIRGVYSVHVGISSFVSSKGCESLDPSGYTRTYPYLEWVRNITGRLW